MTKQHRVPAVLALSAAASLALALTGCDSGGETRAASDGPSVIAPGKPGEDAATLSAEQAAEARPDDSPNQADISYVTKMIEHHRQALVMTALVTDRAESAKVRALAGRIAAAQEPEIPVMEAWLKANADTSHEIHDHEAMPGMATDQQLAALRAARGTGFDALFLKLMTTHHEGAITMAAEVLSGGNTVKVEEMANDVIAQQSSEIGRMRAMG